ncbi:ABC transporter permease subunit [Enterovirga rhinocerotis]|uniref:Putative spermidine/putrescine transport system permease protein n=1 Tax=Enterovirga rhinocerotis TaxID=1339210 RepID=A0A4R7C597_9HYPH|nr:ABC transporter permease subunit [Enterovirga rhinocerotis]TDR93052.1 putative spermidine/putrescine transport system permease protein [Enterovirga rhinocerotis]
MDSRRFDLLLILPLAIFTLAFLVLPLARLTLEAGSGPQGIAGFFVIVTEARFRNSLIVTLILSIITTVATLAVATVAAQTLANRRFFGRGLLLSMLTFPLAFPGVVVGFLIILFGGRLGLVGSVTKSLTGTNVVFAYSLFGLFLGYLYFSVPRVLLTILAAAEKLDPSLVEAARSLGASPLAIQRDVVLPALFPAMYTGGALCFATAMGAFGTAFTLATTVDVIPMLIYTEFTLATNASMAAAISIALGFITWAALAIARSRAMRDVSGA